MQQFVLVCDTTAPRANVARSACERYMGGGVNARLNHPSARLKHQCLHPERTPEASVLASQARPKKKVIFWPLVAWVVVVVACGKADGNASIEISPSALL